MGEEGSGLDISVSEEVCRIAPGVVLCAALVGLDLAKKDVAALEESINKTVTMLRSSLNVDTLKDQPAIRALRDFYWRIRIDPTKQRPASEALVRRVLRGQPFPRVNVVVDSYNLASATTLIPIGAYDYRCLTPPLRLRLSREGETFHDLTGELAPLNTGQIVLSDTTRIVHLFPHRDGYPTRITEHTELAVAVACGVPGLDEALVVDATHVTCDNLTAFAGGRVLAGPVTVR